MNLFIDTSSNKVTLIKFDDNDYTQIVYDAQNDITITIYSKLKELFTREELKSISKIYVITGPGSFTGLRIGVTIAKTIAMELNAKVHPVNILKLQYLLYNQNIAIDAKGKKYFTYDGNVYQIKPIDDINSEYLVDIHIDVELLMSNKNILEVFDEENYLDIKVEYLKDVI